MLTLLLTSALAAGPACTLSAPCDKKNAAACIAAGDTLLAQPACREQALAR